MNGEKSPHKPTGGNGAEATLTPSLLNPANYTIKIQVGAEVPNCEGAKDQQVTQMKRGRSQAKPGSGSKPPKPTKKVVNKERGKPQKQRNKITRYFEFEKQT